MASFILLIPIIALVIYVFGGGGEVVTIDKNPERLLVLYIKHY